MLYSILLVLTALAFLFIGYAFGYYSKGDNVLEKIVYEIKETNAPTTDDDDATGFYDR